ncbi:MAG: glycosyltransferase family 9 protein [Gemmatimonadaceae bacterium]
MTVPPRGIAGGATAAGGPDGAALVIQTAFLGDMVLTTPLIAELAGRGPVDVVATPAGAGLLARHPAVRELIVYDKRGADSGPAGLLRLARRLRSRHYGAAYLAQGSSRSAALALLAGIPRRVGFDGSAGRWLYTDRVPYRDDRHHAERLWRLAAPAGAEPTEAQLRPSLVPGPDDLTAAAALIDGDAASDGGARAAERRPLVALAPGSVWATKRWPYYPALAAALASRARIAIIGGGDDAALASEIREAVSAVPGSCPVVDATGRLSLLASAALVARATVLVTNDSAPLHLGSAVGTATVAIFGPTVPEFGFGPLAPRSITLGHETMPCRPCDRHGPRRCPLVHWRCMRELEVARVAAAVEHLLATIPNS